MKKFTATTRSGATYSSNGTDIIIESSTATLDNQPFLLVEAELRSVDRATHDFSTAIDGIVALPAVEAPILGESIFAIDPNGKWQLSTRVVAVEVHD